MIADENENQPAENRKRNRIWLLTALIAAMLIVSAAGNAYTIYRYINQRAHVVELTRSAAYYSPSYLYFDSLTVDSFKKKVASNEEFVVMLTLSNCSQCERMEAPFIRMAMEKAIADKIYHLNLYLLRQNEAAWAQFKEAYGFEGTPAYARFAGGEQISCVGWTEENGIQFEMVERWIEEQSDYFRS